MRRVGFLFVALALGSTGLLGVTSPAAGNEPPTQPLQPLVGSWNNGGGQVLSWEVSGVGQASAELQQKYGCVGVVNPGDTVTARAKGTFGWWGREYVTDGKYTVSVTLEQGFGYPQASVVAQADGFFGAAPANVVVPADTWLSVSSTYLNPTTAPSGLARVHVSGVSLHNIGGGDPTWADVWIYLCQTYEQPAPAPAPQPVAAPGTPTKFSVSAQKKHKMVFRWSAPLAGGPVTGYTIYVRGKEPKSNWTNWGTFTTTSTSYGLQFRKKGTKVQSYVVATNGDLIGGPTRTISKKTK